MFDPDARYGAVTTELESLLQTCPDVETPEYGNWARTCTMLAFERLSVVNEIKDWIVSSDA